MTILEIEKALATFFELSGGADAFDVNDQDIALFALNEVRKQAELQHDFEFSRRLVQVTVDGVTGGSLDDAVLRSDGTTAVNVKTVIDMGLFDEDGNFRPVEWTTVSEGLERQRAANPRVDPYLTTDDWYLSKPEDCGRFEVSGSQIFRFPKDTENDFTLGIECYTLQSDWDARTNHALDEWLRYGSNYLFWGAVVHLNHLYKHFVFRQEGNLPPPEKQRDAALASFIAWDEARFEQFRRHRR